MAAQIVYITGRANRELPLSTRPRRYSVPAATAALVKGFGCRPVVTYPRVMRVGVRKPPRKEPAGVGWSVCRLWGFDGAAVWVGDTLAGVGGATGELSAALTYWTQSFHVEDPAIRNMLHDIALEEFSHLEMVGRMIEQHTEKSDARDAAYKSTLFAVRGVGPHLVDSKGQAWTSAYVNEGGNVVRDLRADIAAEAGARQTYEALIKLSPDEGSEKALTFLLTREISHTNMFMKALESLGKLTDPNFGYVKPDETVDLYFNLSKDGQLDARGPWNSEPAFQYVDDPTPQGSAPQEVKNPDDERRTARAAR